MASHILIIAAVQEELSGLHERISTPKNLTIGGRRTTSGFLHKKGVQLLTTGPGIANTVQALTTAIEHSRPSLIIQTGCSGAFSEFGLQIGDIGIATEEIDVQLGIEPETDEAHLLDLPFSLIVKRGLDIKNRYPIDKFIINSAFHVIKTAFKNQKYCVKKGPFLTVSTITATNKRAKKLYTQFHACMEAMEGSGAAHVSVHYDIPFIEIRAASNIVGKRDLNSWDLPLAFKNSAIAVCSYIQSLNIKQLK